MSAGRKQLFSSSSSNVSKDVAEYNILLLGALGVGKSALTVKYLTKRFIIEYDPELEDVFSKTEQLDGQEITVKIMDTYDAMSGILSDNDDGRDYLSWAHGLAVVYSITSRPSFDTARSYLEALVAKLRSSDKEMPIALVGNKQDLERYRTVSKLAGEELAAEFESSFYETSAADDLGSVQRVFHDLLREISRVNDGPLTALQPLFISEDQQAHSLSGGRSTGIRRTKSPRTPEILKTDKKDEKMAPRRTVSTFKIFNKGFKIFN